MPVSMCIFSFQPNTHQWSRVSVLCVYKPPQNRQLYPRGVHPAGCRGAAEAGTRQTPGQSVDVPIRQNRRNVSPRLGRNTPQADPQGRGAGAYQVPRPETYIRDLGTAKRRRCKNSVFNAGSLRCWLHPSYLHPCYAADAAKGRGENGQFHGADSISPTGQAEHRKGSSFLSDALSYFPRISACGSRCGSGS